MTIRWAFPAMSVSALVALLVRWVSRRSGATGTEAGRTLPGDELLPAADLQYDRAATIAAPPAAVWPWIAQLGQDRAGFYSFEVLENLVGCRITGATRVHPEWQHVGPGERFRLHPDVALRVAQVEPGSHLLVTSQDGDAPGGTDLAMTWLFHLVPVVLPGGATGTRLHLRERYATGGGRTRVMTELVGAVSAVMTWRMLTRLQVLVVGDGRRPDRAHRLHTSG